MLKEQNTKFKKLLTKTEQTSFILILLISLTSALAFPSLLPPLEITPAQEPYVSIGCDRVIWNGDGLELLATVKNIENPQYQWIIDGKNSTGAVNFGMGEHLVILNVKSGDNTYQAKKSVIVVDSINGISLNNAASGSQWRFQTLYNSKKMGVKAVFVSIDSNPAQEVNPCGQITTKPLPAGKHSWKAEYQGKTLASGSIEVKEISDVKINKIEVAPKYKAGDTVNGKIIVMNTGSTTISEFGINTLAINKKYEWMGDIARMAFSDKYTPELKPGDKYTIPIRVTIPAEVNGIRPTGKYSITIDLVLNNKVADSKVVYTEVE
jgi:hypothetical protein